jgi:hypothetical protein
LSFYRGLNLGAAPLKVGVEVINVVNVEIDVPFEGGSCPLRDLVATNLEVDPSPGPLDDPVDPIRLGG